MDLMLGLEHKNFALKSYVAERDDDLEFTRCCHWDYDRTEVAVAPIREPHDAGDYATEALKILESAGLFGVPIGLCQKLLTKLHH
jgi:hypothetical protein